MEELSKNIRVIRKRWKENQDEFAQRFGMVRTTLSRVESGVYGFTLEHLLKLSKLSGISVERLVEEQLTPDQVPVLPIGEGGEVVPVVQESRKEYKSLDPEVAGMLQAIRELRELLESERSANELSRKELAVLRRKMELMDSEVQQGMRELADRVKRLEE